MVSKIIKVLQEKDSSISGKESTKNLVARREQDLKDLKIQ